MMNGHPREALSAYADDELPPEEARRVEEHLERCTECSRELALTRSIGGAMRRTKPEGPRGTVWEGVHRRLTRPVGWILLVAGLIVWFGLALVGWYRQALTLEWLAATAMIAGLAMLAVGIAYEQYREWRTSPYQDIER